jgi:hypothetical protein
MSSSPDWNAATWEGSRRAQIRRNLRLTVRERLEALEDLTETSDRLARTASETPTESRPPPFGQRPESGRLPTT